jgi:hypothetical protein
MYKTLWMYQKVLHAKTLAHNHQMKVECYPHMEVEDIEYLDNVVDD